MMHSLKVMFFGLVPAPFGILNNSCDLEAFSQPHCLQVWGICLKKQTSQWRQKKLVGCFPLVFIYQIIRTRREVFTILCFRPKMLCKTKTLWGENLVSITVSGVVSILTALVALWDAGVSRSVSQCLVSTKHGIFGALTKDAARIYNDPTLLL